MHLQIAEPGEILWMISGIGVGGSGLALIGIWLEMRWGRRAGRAFSGVLGLLAWALTAILWAKGERIAVIGPLLVLGGACLAACALRTACVRHWASRILEPWTVWTLLLVVSPIFALAYARQVNRPDELPALLAELGSEVGKEVAGPRAVTDLGREIELFHYLDRSKFEKVENSLLEAERFTYEVIRVEGPSAKSNCHGWIFTGGAFGVPSEQVDTILADNGYVPVERAQAGDLVICRNDSGMPTHTGIVRFVGEDGIVLVESKWGPLGVFLHTPETQPYGQQFGFWRSPRLGHRLRILPATPAETVAGIAVTSAQSPW